MSKKQPSAAKKIALGAAIAGAAGYIVGVLSAPKEGRKTRADLKDAATHSVSDVEKQLKQLHKELGDLIKNADITEAAEGKFQAAVQQAGKTKDKLRDVLSAVHEGEASDKDLTKALEDAKKALEHLKEFIKK